MRISDWSSDVCSSDLTEDPRPAAVRVPGRFRKRSGRGKEETSHEQVHGHDRGCGTAGPGGHQCPGRHRSEEHTSELQSLMRMSYAVFCWQKKNKPKTNKPYTEEYLPTTMS